MPKCGIPQGREGKTPLNAEPGSAHAIREAPKSHELGGIVVQLTENEIRSLIAKAKTYAQGSEANLSCADEPANTANRVARLWGQTLRLHRYAGELEAYPYRQLLELQALADYGEQFLEANAQPKTLQTLYQNISPKKAGVLLTGDLAFYIAVRRQLATELEVALQHIHPDEITLTDAE